MRYDDPATTRYLVEWYAPCDSDRAISDVAQRVRQSLAAMPAGAHSTELLYALEVPQDAYAFAVFAADSAELVSEACEQAGLPADRVTEAIEAPLPPMN